jgi:hypothetical protein
LIGAPLHAVDRALIYPVVVDLLKRASFNVDGISGWVTVAQRCKIKAPIECGGVEFGEAGSGSGIGGIACGRQ